MATSVSIPMYGISDIWIKQKQEDAKNGIVRFHANTWMEYNIPVALEKKLTKIVEKELRKFVRQCPCESCKQNRKRKKSK